MNAVRVSKSMPRREFLRITSVAAAGVFAASVMDGSLFAATPEASDPLLSVGYAPALPEKGFSTRLQVADGINPDGAFISRGASVAFLGGARADRYQAAAGGLAIDAVMAVRTHTPENYPHVHVWSVNGRDGLDSYSGPIRFTMPVVATTGLAFIVRQQNGKPIPSSSQQPQLEAQNSPFAISLSNGNGPKLARGVYVVAMRENGNEPAPDWRRFAISNANGVYSVSGANFGYAIMEIDYADEHQREQPVTTRRSNH